VDVVETDTVGVTTNRPNQDDVTGESAAGICPKRDVDGLNAPAVDRHPPKESNAGVRIPGGAVDDLRVVAEGMRRGDDDEVLIVRFARTNHPAPPRPRAIRRADDVELTPPDASGRGQPIRHSRGTRNRIAKLVGRGPALLVKFW
jgi:hypothetical protein